MGKHIFIGIDGTWQAAFKDAFKSNVHRLNVALDCHDDTRQENPQIFIYSAGVGTANRSSRIYAGATGEGMNALILEAYINLASNYEPGDSIYIFGFSRGAFAARALTGFISYAGLLKANQLSLIEDAWIYFTDSNNAKRDYSEQRNGATHQNVRIRFLGLWDTVIGSFRRKSYLERYRFDSLKPANIVNTVVHVISIDDSRWAYKPIFFEGRRKHQNLEQIWMPGVHVDVGGGSNRSFLSTLSLLIMIDKLKQYCPDILFDPRYVGTTLCDILTREKAVVNNERAGIWRWLGQRRRQVANIKHHTLHPVAGTLPLKEIIYKGTPRTKYAPGFTILSGELMPTASFDEASWYRQRIEALLYREFRS